MPASRARGRVGRIAGRLLARDRMHMHAEIFFPKKGVK